MLKKWLVVAVVIILIGVLGIASYQRISAQQTTAQEPAETAVARRGAIFVTIDATGSLAPREEISR